MNDISEKNLAAALTLANAGFRVFPARAIYNSVTQRWNKPPCVSNWRSLATNDLGKISRWWRQYPDAIPAVCCGDFVVVDADRHFNGSDGVFILNDFAKSCGGWPNHPMVLTPSNGEHHYFQQSNPPLGNRTGQLPDGIDVRGVGGFVIGPGAILPNGTGWHLAPGYSTDLPQLPLWLERMIRADEIEQEQHEGIGSRLITRREERYAEIALDAGIADVKNASRGRRNTVLNGVAYRLGRMVGAGWIDRNKVENCLLYAAFVLKNEDGLTTVLATIKSELDAGYRKPHPDLVDRKWGGK